MENYLILLYYWCILVTESYSAASGIEIQSSLHRFSAKDDENRPSLI